MPAVKCPRCNVQLNKGNAWTCTECQVLCHKKCSPVTDEASYRCTDCTGTADDSIDELTNAMNQSSISTPNKWLVQLRALSDTVVDQRLAQLQAQLEAHRATAFKDTKIKAILTQKLKKVGRNELYSELVERLVTINGQCLCVAAAVVQYDVLFGQAVPAAPKQPVPQVAKTAKPPARRCSLKRVALVIGIASYDYGKLNNPCNDAKLIGDTLTIHMPAASKFELIGGQPQMNVNDYQIKALLDDLVNQTDEHTIVLLYFAGHGQAPERTNDPVKLVDNLLVPRNNRHPQLFSVTNILTRLKAQNAHMVLMFLDCCRNFPDRGDDEELDFKHLKSVGSLISYASQEDACAADRSGANPTNSPYAHFLAKSLTSDKDIDTVLLEVQNNVASITNAKQKPCWYNQMTKLPTKDGKLVLTRYNAEMAVTA